VIPPTDKSGDMHPERRRDNQQWLLDWMVKTTGRTHNFAYDHREIPPEVKTYRQIPRVMEKAGRHMETIARAAEAAGLLHYARDLPVGVDLGRYQIGRASWGGRVWGEV